MYVDNSFQFLQNGQIMMHHPHFTDQKNEGVSLHLVSPSNTFLASDFREWNIHGVTQSCQELNNVPVSVMRSFT